jgi:hypothetical protein
MTVAEMENILEHDLVKPFRHDTLDRLEKDGLLEPLFFYPKPKRGTRVERTKRSPLAFPFAIWEAKRASEGNPVAQNILKIKVILKWQQALAKRANLSWVPLVFHFVSVGSEWKIYVCHIQPSAGSTKSKDTFVSPQLRKKRNGAANLRTASTAALVGQLCQPNKSAPASLPRGYHCFVGPVPVQAVRWSVCPHPEKEK